MHSSANDWSDMGFPAMLPQLEVTPTHMQVFMFSAVTWNRHHIHYSRDAAVKEGLPDVVVQRALLGNFFARLLTDWMGHDGVITRLSWKVVASAVPGCTLYCHGAVIDSTSDAAGSRLFTCELQITDATGRHIAQATAQVRVRVASSDVPPRTAPALLVSRACSEEPA
jgi:hydroxyacyl-ACP dehydratase HTD2-like protein with hotdog domain